MIPIIEQDFPLNGSIQEQIQFIFDAIGESCPLCEARITKLRGGITNSVFKFEMPGLNLVVRSYGLNTDEIIDRQREIANIKAVNFIKIYAQFNNGFICSYQAGEALTPADMHLPRVSKSIAALLGEMHKRTQTNSGSRVLVFDKIRLFLAKIPRSFSYEGRPVDFAFIEKSVNHLEEDISQSFKDMPLVLCHMDLHSGNILWDGETASFLDYEYADYSFPQYDIANHFIEFCGFELDMRRYPDLEYQANFVREYLASFFGRNPNECEVNEWVDNIGQFVRVSHLYWGTWAFFQAVYSDVEFPYFDYGTTRLELMDCRHPLPEGHRLRQSHLVDL